jgi:hypothetical protein
MEKPAMPVGPFHHRRDGKSAVDLQRSAFLLAEPSHSKIVEPVKLTHSAPRKRG